MASSKQALRALQRSVPSAPCLRVRRFATTPARAVYNSNSSSKTGSVATASSEDKNPYPPSQYPNEDKSPLPQVQTSFDPALTQSALATALSQASQERAVDWGTSYLGLSTEPFSKEAQAILQAPIPDNDVEVKPDGIIYLPEIKYRRILNAAFGPGGWGLAPRGELHVGEKVVTREFALVVSGRFAAQARGECGYYGDDNIPNAVEGCKSNALMRCCKDLGIASELWDPRFIRKWKKEYSKDVEVYYGYGVSAKKKKIAMRKDDEIVAPYRPIEPARTGSSPSPYRPSSGTSYSSPTAARPTTAAKSTTTTAARATPAKTI